MCISLEALTLFLALLPSEIVTHEVDRITVHAELRDAVWLAKDDKWCTEAPKIDRMIRFGEGEPA